MHDFKTRYGPWALVAGASEGLGAAFAEALARRGLNLILLARREAKLAAMAVALQDQYPVSVQYRALDLADQEKTREYVESLSADIGLLVFNAAYSPIGYFQDIPLEQLQQIVQVNITAPLTLSRLLAPGLLARGKGGLVLMSSLAGNQGGAKIATYAASKAFNTILAEGLWQEMKSRGIDVLASCAGAIRTPAYQQAQNGKEAPGTLEAIAVAEQTLLALGRGPTFVPGRINKIARFFMSRLLPRKTAIGLMAKNTQNLT
jgi:short-subunit dehydrogenase